MTFLNHIINFFVFFPQPFILATIGCLIIWLFINHRFGTKQFYIDKWKKMIDRLTVYFTIMLLITGTMFSLQNQANRVVLSQDKFEPEHAEIAEHESIKAGQPITDRMLKPSEHDIDKKLDFKDQIKK